MRRRPLCFWHLGVYVFFALIGASSLAYGQSAALMQNHRQGVTLFKAGKFEEAIPFLERAAALSEREFGPTASLTGFEVKNLATLHEKVGNSDRAAILFQRAAKILTTSLGAGHPVTQETIAQSSQADIRALNEESQRMPITLTPPSHASRPKSSVPRGDPGGWKVQLGAFTSLDNARKVAMGLGRSLKGVLVGIELEIREAQIASGRIYRIQTPPVAERPVARALCAQIKAGMVPCFIIK
jgi:hypothetical protein